MGKFMNPWILIALGSLMTALARADVSPFVSVVGEVWSFDRETVTLRISERVTWRIHRRLLKRGFELRPGMRLGVTVPEAEIQEQRI